MTNTPTTTAGQASDVPDFPMPRAVGCPFDPSPALQTMQAETPITRVKYWDGSTPWLVTRYDDQRALFADPRISADSSHPNHPHQTPGFRESQKKGRSFIKLDDPEHARLRRMVSAQFSVKRSEALRPAIQKIVDGLIDDLLAGPKPVDLVESFALVVPSLVICDLLGVSYSHHAFFEENAKQLTEREVTDEQGAAGQRRLAEYIDNLLSEKLSNPGDDVLSDITERVKSGELSREDAVRTGVLLLVAGHDTTANMIALGTLALLQHPDQLAILRQTSDPKLIAGAVEELLRYLTIPHGGRPRVALADIEIGGQVIHADDPVLLAIEMANRDPAVFPDPDRLDILREARHHVAFLYGPHQCLGQNLARVELQVVYSTLSKRIPTLRLATDMDKVQFRNNATVYGVYELPVTW
ncbi:MAG TPA: cytochrome P450 [Streptosporangiaceae bacterium]